MKLKFYLLGLGVGIILTTFILTISNRPIQLSDQEIINRAMKLGMVMEKKQDNNIDSFLESIKSSSNTISDKREEKEEKKGEKSEYDKELEDKVNNITPTVGPIVNTEPTPSPEIEEDITDNKDIISEDVADKVDMEETQDQKYVTFKITRGMTATDVAELLYELKLIDDPVKFNQYIKKNNNTGNIIVNKYTIKKGSSYKEIMNTIITY